MVAQRSPVSPCLQFKLIIYCLLLYYVETCSFPFLSAQRSSNRKQNSWVVYSPIKITIQPSSCLEREILLFYSLYASTTTETLRTLTQCLGNLQGNYLLNTCNWYFAYISILVYFVLQLPTTDSFSKVHQILIPLALAKHLHKKIWSDPGFIRGQMKGQGRLGGKRQCNGKASFSDCKRPEALLQAGMPREAPCRACGSLRDEQQDVAR